MIKPCLKKSSYNAGSDAYIHLPLRPLAEICLSFSSGIIGGSAVVRSVSNLSSWLPVGLTIKPSCPLFGVERTLTVVLSFFNLDPLMRVDDVWSCSSFLGHWLSTTTDLLGICKCSWHEFWGTWKVLFFSCSIGLIDIILLSHCSPPPACNRRQNHACTIWWLEEVAFGICIMDNPFVSSCAILYLFNGALSSTFFLCCCSLLINSFAGILQAAEYMEFISGSTFFGDPPPTSHFPTNSSQRFLSQIAICDLVTKVCENHPTLCTCCWWSHYVLKLMEANHRSTFHIQPHENVSICRCENVLDVWKQWSQDLSCESIVFFEQIYVSWCCSRW